MPKDHQFVPSIFGEQEYKTTDILLATYLDEKVGMLRLEPYQSAKYYNSYVFIFMNTDAVQKYVADWYAFKVTVEPRAFHARMKQLKSLASTGNVAVR